MILHNDSWLICTVLFIPYCTDSIVCLYIYINICMYWCEWVCVCVYTHVFVCKTVSINYFCWLFSLQNICNRAIECIVYIVIFTYNCVAHCWLFIVHISSIRWHGHVTIKTKNIPREIPIKTKNVPREEWLDESWGIETKYE